jgi:hypothetical protein
MSSASSNFDPAAWEGHSPSRVSDRERQPPSLDTDRILIETSSKEPYGVDSKLDASTRFAIIQARMQSDEGRIQFLKDKAKLLISVAAKSHDRDRQIKESISSPHVAKIYKGKNLGLLDCYMRMLERFYPPENCKQMQKKFTSVFTKGIPLTGDLLPGGFWEESEEKEASKSRSKVFVRSNSLPSTYWSTDGDRQHLLDKAIKLSSGDDPSWEEVSEEIAWTGIPPVIAFGVWQGTKTAPRLCVDFRGPNGQLKTNEDMRLPGTRTQIEAMYLCEECGNGILPAAFQLKRDLNRGIEFERKLTNTIGLNLDNDRDMELLRSIVADEEALLKGRSLPGRPFKAYAFLHDQSAYYNQFAVANSDHNVVALACPSSDPVYPLPTSKPPSTSEKQNPVPRWRFFRSPCALFGALSSVFDCVWASELHAAILCYVLGLISTMYIDDLTSFERSSAFREARYLAVLWFNLAGWTLSMDKEELQLTEDRGKMIQKAITSLGIDLDRPNNGLMRFSIAEARLEKCRLRLQACRENLSSAYPDLSWKGLASATGLFRFCTQFDKVYAGYVRCADSWQEHNWQARLKDPVCRKQLVAILHHLERALKGVSPRIIDPSKPLVHFYGDCALEDFEGLKVKLAGGVRDVESHKIIFAGIITRKDETPRAFRIHVKTLPSWCESFNIMTGEGLAILLGIIFFKDIFKSSMVVVHCDNMSDCFAFLKGVSGHAVTSAIISITHEELRGCDFYWAWIRTDRNIADLPTRPEKFLLLEKFFGKLDFVVLDEGLIPWARIKEMFTVFRNLSIKASFVGLSGPRPTSALLPSSKSSDPSRSPPEPAYTDLGRWQENRELEVLENADPPTSAPITKRARAKARDQSSLIAGDDSLIPNHGDEFVPIAKRHRINLPVRASPLKFGPSRWSQGPYDRDDPHGVWDRGDRLALSLPAMAYRVIPVVSPPATITSDSLCLSQVPPGAAKRVTFCDEVTFFEADARSFSCVERSAEDDTRDGINASQMKKRMKK